MRRVLKLRKSNPERVSFCLLSSVFFSHEQRLFSEPDKPVVEAKIKAMAARAETRYTCGTKDILGMAQRLAE